MATTNCVATFGLVGPRAGISIGICVPETVTEPIPVVRNRANSTTITMTITLRRCRSSSKSSKKVIRRSLGRSSSEATFATAVIAAKRARLMYFPQMHGSESPSEGVAVLGQRIRGVAVPADLPVSELFLVRERDGAHPLRTLVRIALRHEEPYGAPVFDRERLAVPLVREQDVGIVEDIERMGRRVAIAAPEGREAGGRADLRALRHFADRDPDPLVVERGPARDAMERGNHSCGRKSQKLVVREADRLVDRAVHAEVPLLRVEPGDDAQVEPRPFPNLPLPGRETSLRRHPTETIEIPRYKSLCLTFEGLGCGATRRRIGRRCEPALSGENAPLECPDKGLIARPIFHATDMVLESYVPVVIFAVVALLFPLGTFFATRLFRPDHPTPLKDLTYECGEVPEGVAQIQFHFQYYMFALIFVIFDVAAIFLLLWAFAWGGLLNSVSPVAKFSIFLFLGIMFVATQYALKKEEVIQI